MGESAVAEPMTLSMQGLVQKFRTIHQTMENRNFCFILGAGASVSSGIKSAADMVKEWIDICYREGTIDTGPVPEKWPCDANLGITGFRPGDHAASYSSMYRRMYQKDPDAGFAYLEDQLSGAKPSFGYSMLGRILADTRHRVVITVNFDNLVADAVSLFSKTYPLVCGHELLASFVTARPRRPLILKVHRDLLLSPMSDETQLNVIDENLKDAVHRLLRNYTPIVIGYGGNDNSLMDCLETLPAGDMPGGIYWCFRGTPPLQKIKNVVEKHNGKLVDIMGFDELLMQLGDVLNYTAAEAAKTVLARATDLAKRIEESAEELGSKIAKRNSDSITSSSPRPDQSKDAKEAKEYTAAVGESMSRVMSDHVGKKSWWQWAFQAQAEADPEKRNEIYREATEALPKSAELLRNYAYFLTTIRKDYDAAEALYKRAIDADPKHASALGNYALILADIRKDHEVAEALYKRAIDADPKYANALGNYANFLTTIRKDHDAAEAFYKRAIDADPKDANILGSYAYFLTEFRKDHDAAEGLYKQAIDADPKNANTLGNYARMLFEIGRIDEGLDELGQAIGLIKDREPDQVHLECWMYAYCCRSLNQKSEALRQLRSLITQTEVRTDDWDFSGVIAQAIKMGHPEAKWLPKLAEVLSGRAKPSILSRWTAWKNALVATAK